MNGLGRGSDSKKNSGKSSVLTRETVGMTLLLFSAIILLICATGRHLFGDVGLAIGAFFVGLSGFYVYPLLALLIYVSLRLVFGKKLLPRGYVLRGTLVVLAVFFIVHTATAERFAALGYGEYLSACWKAAGEGIGKGTGGGILLGLVAYPVRFLLQAAGAYVLFSLLLLLSLWFFLLLTPLKSYLVPGANRPRREPKQENEGHAGGMSFDDLSTPERTSYARREEPASPAMQPEPIYVSEPVRPSTRSTQPTAMSEGRGEAYARSMDILFSDNPAESYRANLIYDADSRFNSQPRRSSMERTEAPKGDGSYSESYHRQAEAARPSMPRRVTDERPAGTDGYSYPVREEFDANYPQMPSFRAAAPAAPAMPEERDYYVNDVAPAAEEEVIPPPAPVQPEEPALPSTPARSEYLDVPSNPLENESRFPSARSEYLDVPKADEEAPRADEPTVPLSGRERDAAFRSIFSQSVEERTPIRGEFDLGRRRSVPEQEESEESELPRASRAFDGLGSAANLFDDDDDEEPTLPALPERGRDLRGDMPAPRMRGESFEPTPPAPPAPPVEPPKAEPEPPKPKKKKHVWKRYKRPDLELLDTYEDKVTLSREEIGRNSGTILDTLARYKIETNVIDVKGGAAVTRYDLAMPSNATIGMVVKYSGEIALYLKVKGVNMYANPEVGGISVEVPNQKRATVGLKSILQSDAFQKKDPAALTFALGQDVEGRSICGDITEMTHILIAGMTGSGKSITMHAMLISMLCKYSPEELRLILIDPKQSEFTIYEGLPHLMINEIITQAPKAVAALNWAIQEMERRYTIFNEKTRSGTAVRKIDEYNENLTEDEERLPKIVIVVDEFGDLMLVAKKELEEKIQRLTQKARAAGIHLVLATQRPSADVVTGVIKSNLPTRIALSVDSDLNSRIILDENGAEKLLGYGDMLVKAGGRPRRAQGAYISSKETQRIVNYIKENNETYFDDDMSAFLNKTDEPAEPDDVPASEGRRGGSNNEDLNLRALAAVVRLGQASISLIQRKLGVGYNHAGKIIEWMESQGYISPFDGKAKARTVLLTKQEFEAKYGPLD